LPCWPRNQGCQGAPVASTGTPSAAQVVASGQVFSRVAAPRIGSIPSLTEGPSPPPPCGRVRPVVLDDDLDVPARLGRGKGTDVAVVAFYGTGRRAALRRDLAGLDLRPLRDRGCRKPPKWQGRSRLTRAGSGGASAWSVLPWVGCQTSGRRPAHAARRRFRSSSRPGAGGLHRVPHLDGVGAVGARLRKARRARRLAGGASDCAQSRSPAPARTPADRRPSDAASASAFEDCATGSSGAGARSSGGIGRDAGGRVPATDL
jgi:hypothetical protein